MDRAACPQRRSKRPSSCKRATAELNLRVRQCSGMSPDGKSWTIRNRSMSSHGGPRARHVGFEETASEVKVDVIVLGVLVLTALMLAPGGHGLWGWALALVAGLSVGVVVGIFGRRYPWIHRQPPRARRTRRS